MSFTINTGSGGVSNVPQGPSVVVNGVVSDLTTLGTLTAVIDPAFLLVGDATGDAVRKLTPSAWGMANLLTSIPAGRVPYSHTDGTPTSNAALTFNPTTGVLAVGQIGGVAGTDEVEVSHDGANGRVSSRDGALNLSSDGSGAVNLQYFGSTRVSTGNTSFSFESGGSSAWIYSSTGAGYVSVRSTDSYQWSSGSTAWSGRDTGLARAAAGVVEINNGTAGQYRDLLVRAISFMGSGTVKGGFGVGVVLAGYDNNYLHLKPGSREYRIGTYDAAGRMMFARSDSANALYFQPDSAAVSLSALVGKLVLYGAQDSIVLTPSGAGGVGNIELGQRYTDSTASVGANVRCWTATGQTGNALSILAPGGSSALAGFVASSGRLSFATSDSAPAVPATPLLWLDVLVGGITYKMPLYQ